MFSLFDLGWSDFFASGAASAKESNDPKLASARVAEESHELYRLLCPQGIFLADLAGKLRHQAAAREDLPAVGDWVLAQLDPDSSRGVIHSVLPRKSKFSRKAAGRKTDEQIVAANIDVVFLVTSLNRDFNPRRLERYLAVAWDSGARPVILLNKADLSANAEELRAQTKQAAPGVEVLLTSAVLGQGVEQIRAVLKAGVTAAFLGSSGVGKSSLINALLCESEAELLPTRPVRESDDRGRHTTTSRNLLVLPSGGILIDTPGMRELQLWDTVDGIQRSFRDVHDLASRCRFRDCTHQREPGCTVLAAVASGALDASRLQNLHKLEREERFIEAKQDAAVRAQRGKELRRLMKSVNRFYRDRGR